MPTATVNDIKQVIATSLDDPDISDSLSYAEEWNRSNGTPGQQSSTETKNIERWVAVINIRQYKEKSVEEDSAGDSSAMYEGNELERARSELAQWLEIAGENPLLASRLIRDSNRYTGSATPN